MRVHRYGFRIFEITHTQRDLLILVYIHTYSLFARRINKLAQFDHAPQNLATHRKRGWSLCMYVRF